MQYYPQYSADTASSLRRSLRGETEHAIQETLQAAWGQGIEFNKLFSTRINDGAINYCHPETGNMIVSYRVRPSFEEKVQPAKEKNQSTKRNIWKPRHVKGRTRRPAPYTVWHPETFVFTVYSPQGYAATAIKGQFIALSPDDKLRYIVEIKDFYPPSAPQQSKQEKHAERNEKDRDISLARRAARKVRQDCKDKLLNGEGDTLNGETSWPFDMGIYDAAARAGRIHTARSAASNDTLNGKTRRERTFKPIPQSLDRVGGDVNNRHSIENRRLSDRTNNTDGTYVVKQFTSGGAYSETTYNRGRRASLISYDKQGCVVKKLGAEPLNTKAETHPQPLPPDRIKKRDLTASAIMSVARQDLG